MGGLEVGLAALALAAQTVGSNADSDKGSGAGVRFVSLCPCVRAAAVHTVRWGSESHSRAVNHRPQTDSCVVLRRGNIQMLGRDVFHTWKKKGFSRVV